MGQQRLYVGISEHSYTGGTTLVLLSSFDCYQLGDLIRRIEGARRNPCVREFLRQLTREFLSSFELLDNFDESECGSVGLLSILRASGNTALSSPCWYLLATMRRVVNYHSSWFGQQQVELLMYLVFRVWCKDERVIPVCLYKHQWPLTFLRRICYQLCRRRAPQPPPPCAVARLRRKFVSGQFDEENPFVLISSVLLVQADEGVSFLVVDRIGDIYHNLPRRADVIVTTVGAKHKCQQGSVLTPYV
ncbi:hypothetical protein F511_32572 [Dorcoceras hygrometricum]|uniref:Uncharacterized protein n=1 Tax=Dorcoceras hygrometricum TaxID=472368 RepID=A0A2Z7C4R2_9LAMI|nr:hypothetical protein F511_32572 [Dorcoceras hygrometricum]